MVTRHHHESLGTKHTKWLRRLLDEGSPQGTKEHMICSRIFQQRVNKT